MRPDLTSHEKSLALSPNNSMQLLNNTSEQQDPYGVCHFRFHDSSCWLWAELRGRKEAAAATYAQIRENFTCGGVGTGGKEEGAE